MAVEITPQGERNKAILGQVAGMLPTDEPGIKVGPVYVNRKQRAGLVLEIDGVKYILSLQEVTNDNPSE